MPSSLFAMKITKWLRGRPIFTRLLKKLEIRPVNWWQSQCYSIKTRFSNLEKTFELRMVSHKVKQINASLRFTNVVLLCLIKVIKISSGQQKCIYLYRQNCTIMNQNRQNHIPLNDRSWNKEESWWKPEEIVFLKTETNLVYYPMSSTIIKMPHWSFLDFHITFWPLPWESNEAQDHRRRCGYFLFNSYFLLLLEFEVSQLKRPVFWCDVLKLHQVTRPTFLLDWLA